MRHAVELLGNVVEPSERCLAAVVSLWFDAGIGRRWARRQ
jgi:hypothetical protein